jgi:hypothetical protein
MSRADLPKSAVRTLNSVLFWWVGTTFDIFPHKTFVGKIFRDHKHLPAVSGVNQGRWVYEGASLSMRKSKNRTSALERDPRPCSDEPFGALLAQVSGVVAYLDGDVRPL